MTEPTEEQVKAFKEAWEDEDRSQQEQFKAFSGPFEPGARTRAGLRAVFATFPEDEGFTVIDGDKDVETSQPAYDDHMTRQFLVQVLPNASVSELEQKRAWIAGETGAGVDVRRAVREVLLEVSASSKRPQDITQAFEDISRIVGFNA